jgi:hypothetical protein
MKIINEMLWKLNFKPKSFKFRIWLQSFKPKREKIHFLEAETLDESGMAPYPRDADLKNGSRRKGERDTPAKQHQGKAWSTKAQQDLPVNVAINNFLLICKA